jgi:hypothetical protein
MRKATLVKTGMAGAAAVALTVGLALPAHADPQAQASDAVIVGSDTAQFLASFVDDGMTAISGTSGLTAGSGYNKTNKNRIFSYDATADALGRVVTMDGGANPGVVLRAGSAPTHLPNGSGDGYNVFYNDTAGAKQIDFVRGSRMPNATDIQNMQNVGGDHYHTWRIATDGMQIAVSNAETNSPAAGLTKAQLQKIYEASPEDTTWTQVGGTSSDLIVPLLPQDGSGTHDDFLNDLFSSKTTPANSHLVRTEEHDPSPLTAAGFATAITNAGGTDLHTTDAAGNEKFSWQGGTVTVADAISPFSTGRYNLIQTGYFDVNHTAVGDPVWKNAIKLLPSSAYNFARSLYLSSRESDFEASGGWQTGSQTNKINAVINQYKNSFNAPLFTDAGVTQAFKDCGEDVTTC